MDIRRKMELQERLRKAREGLVARKKTVYRKGKAVQTTVYVRPGEKRAADKEAIRAKAGKKLAGTGKAAMDAATEAAKRALGADAVVKYGLRTEWDKKPEYYVETKDAVYPGAKTPGKAVESVVSELRNRAGDMGFKTIGEVLVYERGLGRASTFAKRLERAGWHEDDAYDFAITAYDEAVSRATKGGKSMTAEVAKKAVAAAAKAVEGEA